MSLSTDDDIQFDRSTLHPSLYISADNKTFSNRPTSYTQLYDRKDNRYIHDVLLSVASIEDTYTIVNIEFTHIVGLKLGTQLFEIDLGRNKNGQFIEDFRFECIICRQATIFRDGGYCLQSRDGHSVIVPNFRIIMHYQIKKKLLSLYISDTVGLRRYYIYKTRTLIVFFLHFILEK